MTPKQIGNYFVEEKVGSGGMGVVYRGRHVETNQVVAIKVLSSALSSEEGFRARFEREIQSLEALKNPHVVEFYESGQDGETYFYAMEFVEGITLTQHLRDMKQLAWREVIDISVQICSALKAAHDAGIIHRDLKPSNLMLKPDGFVKLTDFGVAQVFAGGKLTMTGGIIGTAEFMSPEQAQGRRATKKSDIYSLGTVMYAMLVGRPPFSGKTTVEVLQKHKFGQFDSARTMVPEVPRWLDEIVTQCLEKKPEDRYPDAYVLSLRLKEVAKKIELSQSDQTSVMDSPSGTSVTKVASEGGEDGVQELGGTLMRDLVKAEIERIEEKTPFGKILDNTYVLIGLMFVVLLGGWYFWKIQNPPAEKRFELGKTLFSSGEINWNEAREKYFLPLLEEDEEVWSNRVVPYLEEIEIYDIKKAFGIEKKAIHFRQKKLTISEPRRLLKRAKGYFELGDLAQADATLTALLNILKNDPEKKVLSKAVEEIQYAIQNQNDVNEKRAEWLDGTIKQALRFEERNQKEKAIEILEALHMLYETDYRVDKQVEEIAGHLERLKK